MRDLFQNAWFLLLLLELRRILQFSKATTYGHENWWCDFIYVEWLGWLILNKSKKIRIASNLNLFLIININLIWWILCSNFDELDKDILSFLSLQGEWADTAYYIYVLYACNKMKCYLCLYGIRDTRAVFINFTFTRIWRYSSME